jgi:hypothetical protein
VACSGFDNNVHLYQQATGNQVGQIGNVEDAVLSFAFSADGKFLASVGTRDPSVRLWDIGTGKQLGNWRNYRGRMLSVAFSPDLNTLGTITRDRDVFQMWDIKTGREARRFGPRDHNLGEIFAYSPDGRALALVTFGGTLSHQVGLWEILTGKQRCSFRGHDDAVCCLAFSPDGKFLASGSRDTSIVIWDLIGKMDKLPIGSGALSQKTLDGMWADLACDDAAVAYRAICRLQARPAEALRLVKTRVLPARRAAAQTVAKLISELDSNRFTIRAKASQELEELGDVVESALEQALKEQPTLERRRRVEELLERLASPRLSPGSLQSLRAIEVVEHIGTPAACEVLQGLACGAPTARLTREAELAVCRLRRQLASYAPEGPGKRRDTKPSGPR